MGRGSAEDATRSDAGAILAVARRLAPQGVHLFFKHGARFHDPLVPAQWEALRADPVLEDAGVRDVVLEALPGRAERLARGIYSPVPIARGLDAGRPFESLLDEFRYEMIRVDEDQRWTWMGRPVAPRIKTFFLEHLGWEPAIGRWCFEYQVNPEWFDKSYFDAMVTPLLASTVREDRGAATVTLNNGADDALDLDTLRLDERERLFATSARFGEVLFSDAVRFSVLRHANDACDAVRVAGAWHPLRWPAATS